MSELLHNILGQSELSVLSGGGGGDGAKAQRRQKIGVSKQRRVAEAHHRVGRKLEDLGHNWVTRIAE